MVLQITYEGLIKELNYLKDDLTLGKVNIKNRTIFNYIELKRPVDSVRKLNRYYRTIEYDNIEENNKYIDSLKTKDSTYDFMNFVIMITSIFYKYNINKPTWIRYRKDLKLDYFLTNNTNINMVAYSNYYMLKCFQAFLNGMIDAIDYMYSDKCKNKDVIKNIHYNKGREYFITAIDACQTMIYELLIVNGFLIKTHNVFLKNSTNPTLPFIKKNQQTYNTSELGIPIICYNHNLNIHESQLSTFKSFLTKQSANELFKRNNKELYIMILDLLQPCDFLMLIRRMSVYKYRMSMNIYFNRIINNIPKPEYMGDNIKITCDIN